jgi:hypothetical protein
MLTQTESDYLKNLQKRKKTNERLSFPPAGKFLIIPIISLDELENFLIDIHRGRRNFAKCTYQERCRESIVLVRVDINGSQHPNPEATTVPLQILEPYNGKIIDCPHMHLYIEGFSDRWAIPIPVDKFSNTDDLIKSLTDFLNYCNVVDKPSVGAMSLNGY